MVRLGDAEIAKLKQEVFAFSNPDQTPQFIEVDADHNGKIDRQEMAVLFRKIAAESGQEMDIDAAVENIFAHFDMDHDGFIDFHEYITTIIPASELQLLKAEFDKVDTDGDGKVNRAELSAMFAAIPGMPPAQVPSMVENIFRAFDKNGNGVIDFYEYINFNK